MDRGLFGVDLSSLPCTEGDPRYGKRIVLLGETLYDVRKGKTEKETVDHNTRQSSVCVTKTDTDQ